MICKKCGKECDLTDSDIEELESIYSSESDISSYIPLFQDSGYCKDCLDEILGNRYEGYLFLSCDICGSKFDFFECISHLKNDYGHKYDYFDYDELTDSDALCYSCASNKIEEDEEEAKEHLGEPSDSSDDMPEVCKVCGGPYPNCTGCKIIDDDDR